MKFKMKTAFFVSLAVFTAAVLVRAYADNMTAPVATSPGYESGKSDTGPKTKSAPSKSKPKPKRKHRQAKNQN